MIEERTFPNDATSVTQARRHVVRALGDVAPEVTDAVALMVSELSANAVRHTATRFTVTLDRTDSRIRVLVTDSGPGQPIVRTPDPTEPSGRGLQIVEALADEWGILPSPDGQGKTVWFALEIPAGIDDAARRREGDVESESRPTGTSSMTSARTQARPGPGPKAQARARYRSRT